MRHEALVNIPRSNCPITWNFIVLFLGDGWLLNRRCLLLPVVLLTNNPIEQTTAQSPPLVLLIDQVPFFFGKMQSIWLSDHVVICLFCLSWVGISQDTLLACRFRFTWWASHQARFGTLFNWASRNWALFVGFYFWERRIEAWIDNVDFLFHEFWLSFFLILLVFFNCLQKHVFECSFYLIRIWIIDLFLGSRSLVLFVRLDGVFGVQNVPLRWYWVS